MVDINRTSGFDLPPDVSAEILQKTQDQSAVMSLSRQMPLPGKGVSIPVITGDPTAGWVGETSKAPVSNGTLSKKIMTPYKLAVIEPFSREFLRDAASLYDALVARIPLALAKQFDLTTIGGITAPGSNFDTFAGCTAQAVTAATAYAQIVAADTDIANHGGIANGFAISPQFKGVLLTAADSTGRPLFINSMADGAIPMILGAKTLQSRGMYKAGTPNIAAIMGDWSQAMYGTVEGVQVKLSDQATLTSGETTINLFEQDMVAIRAEIEIGFRADTSVFDLLTLAS